MPQSHHTEEQLVWSNRASEKISALKPLRYHGLQGCFLGFDMSPLGGSSQPLYSGLGLRVHLTVELQQMWVHPIWALPS
jgi:hypothetical protein